MTVHPSLADLGAAANAQAAEYRRQAAAAQATPSLPEEGMARLRRTGADVGGMLRRARDYMANSGYDAQQRGRPIINPTMTDLYQQGSLPPINYDLPPEMQDAYKQAFADRARYANVAVPQPDTAARSERALDAVRQQRLGESVRRTAEENLPPAGAEVIDTGIYSEPGDIPIYKTKVPKALRDKYGDAYYSDNQFTAARDFSPVGTPEHEKWSALADKRMKAIGDQTKAREQARQVAAQEAAWAPQNAKDYTARLTAQANARKSDVDARAAEANIPNREAQNARDAQEKEALLPGNQMIDQYLKTHEGASEDEAERAALVEMLNSDFDVGKQGGARLRGLQTRLNQELGGLANTNSHYGIVGTFNPNTVDTALSRLADYDVNDAGTTGSRLDSRLGKYSQATLRFGGQDIALTKQQADAYLPILRAYRAAALRRKSGIANERYIPQDAP